MQPRLGAFQVRGCKRRHWLCSIPTRVTQQTLLTALAYFWSAPRPLRSQTHSQSLWRLLLSTTLLAWARLSSLVFSTGLVGNVSNRTLSSESMRLRDKRRVDRGSAKHERHATQMLRRPSLCLFYCLAFSYCLSDSSVFTFSSLHRNRHSFLQSPSCRHEEPTFA